MHLLPLDHLLTHQTLIVQELGLYLSQSLYAPTSRDFVLLCDLQARATDTVAVCRHLEVEFWKRSRKEE